MDVCAYTCTYLYATIIIENRIFEFERERRGMGYSLKGRTKREMMKLFQKGIIKRIYYQHE